MLRNWLIERSSFSIEAKALRSGSYTTATAVLLSQTAQKRKRVVATISRPEICCCRTELAPTGLHHSKTEREDYAATEH